LSCFVLLCRFRPRVARQISCCQDWNARRGKARLLRIERVSERASERASGFLPPSAAWSVLRKAPRAAVRACCSCAHPTPARWRGRERERNVGGVLVSAQEHGGEGNNTPTPHPNTPERQKETRKQGLTVPLYWQQQYERKGEKWSEGAREKDGDLGLLKRLPVSCPMHVDVLPAKYC
jgi:hypothetical protein